MKVQYDEKHNIAYIRFSQKKPDGAIEIDEGVVLDTLIPPPQTKLLGLRSSMPSSACRLRAYSNL